MALATTPTASDRLGLVPKHFVQRHIQRNRDLEGGFQRRRVSLLFDGYNRLAGNTDLFRKFLLGHFVAMKSQRTNVVLNVCLTHTASTR